MTETKVLIGCTLLLVAVALLLASRTSAIPNFINSSDSHMVMIGNVQCEKTDVAVDFGRNGKVLYCAEWK